jgi:hypothetical protein
MKAKLLLIYGYLLPIAGSVAVAALAGVIGQVTYVEIAQYFRNQIGLILAYIAIVGALTFPFQSKILSEDNSAVLEVLAGTGVREVFSRASAFQAGLIVIVSLCLLIGCTAFAPSSLVGLWEIFAFSLIGFESLALISNGRTYGAMREKIINKSNNKSQS